MSCNIYSSFIVLIPYPTNTLIPFSFLSTFSIPFECSYFLTKTLVKRINIKLLNKNIQKQQFELSSPVVYTNVWSGRYNLCNLFFILSFQLKNNCYTSLIRLETRHKRSIQGKWRRKRQWKSRGMWWQENTGP